MTRPNGHTHQRAACHPHAAPRARPVSPHRSRTFDLERFERRRLYASLFFTAVVAVWIAALVWWGLQALDIGGLIAALREGR